MPAFASLQPVDRILERFKEALGEKYMLAKLLLHTQEPYEESEMLLRRFLNKEDIEWLISEHSPFKDSGGTATVGARYVHVVCEDTLLPSSVYPHVVCQNLFSMLLNC